MYENLMKYALNNGLTFSAYDDLTFFLKKPIPKISLKEIVNIIESFNLKVIKRNQKLVKLIIRKLQGVLLLREIKSSRKLQKRDVRFI